MEFSNGILNKVSHVMMKLPLMSSSLWAVPAYLAKIWNCEIFDLTALVQVNSRENIQFFGLFYPSTPWTDWSTDHLFRVDIFTHLRKFILAKKQWRGHTRKFLTLIIQNFIILSWCAICKNFRILALADSHIWTLLSAIYRCQCRIQTR